MLTISSISALKDNYIWVIENLDKHCIVVDPGDAAPVLEALKRNHLKLDAIFLTHHHYDHTDGVAELVQHFPKIAVYGPASSKMPEVTHPVSDKDVFTILDTQFTISAIPGHTLEHICYYTKGMLFCGDTLFSVGCGKIFEGTPEQMYQSLSLIASLPDETKVYCAHEYTQANIRFALVADPNNAELKQYSDKIDKLRSKGKSSLPSTIGIEKNINPFLRTAQETIRSTIKKRTNVQTDVDTFAALRRWKDEF